MAKAPKTEPQLGRPAPIPASPDQAVLDSVPNPQAGKKYVVRFTAPEFTSICPVTGQPDFGILVIDYVPDRWLIESKSLKLYLQSFRNHGAFHEDVTVTIGKRIADTLKPTWLRIGGYFNPRGGMPIDVFWQTGTPPAEALAAGPRRRALSRAGIAGVTKTRMEAFSDGVLAIVITILVLELPAPEGADWSALRPVIPAFVSHVLSFVYLGIYWNNHHHMLQVATRVNGAILWANLHLLFWLALVPFVTGWMGENRFATIPVAVYGVCLLLAAVAYTVLERLLIAAQGKDSPLQNAVGSDIKGWVSIGCYCAGIAATLLWTPWIGLAFYAFVALMWLVPDPRIERMMRREA